MTTKPPPASPPQPIETEREVDRAAILARRAMFITTALASLGCTSSGGTATPPVPGVTTAATPEPQPQPCLSVPIQRDPPPVSRRFADVEKLAPPRTVSDKLPAEEREALAQQAGSLNVAYEKLAHAYEATPIACSPDDPKCEATWVQVVDDLRVVRDTIEEPLCGGSDFVGEAQRFAAHQRFLGQQADAIEAELAAAAKRWRAEGKWAAWAQQISPPQPCLKCAMPEPRMVATSRYGNEPLAIGFAAGDSSVAANAVEELKTSLDEEPALKIVLRGHADPSEADPDRLALARAKAVQAQLVAKGIKAGRIAVNSFGAELPIGPLATPEGQAMNRRVDVDRASK